MVFLPWAASLHPGVPKSYYACPPFTPPAVHLDLGLAQLGGNVGSALRLKIQGLTALTFPTFFRDWIVESLKLSI